jgi:serine/threonine protein kinase
MKSFSKTLTLGSRFAHLYRPLVRNLVIIVAGTIALAAAALLYFDERLVDSLSGRLIEKGAQRMSEKLKRLFDATGSSLRIAQRQVAPLDITDAGQRAELFAMLAPFLAGLDFLDSINLADPAGNEYVLIKQPGEILTRHVNAGDGGIARWVDGKTAEQWTRKHATSPLTRPWYQGAMRRAPGEHYWTAPYAFLTTKQPGLSVSSRARRPGSDVEYVIAFNISLMEISQYTTQLRPSDNGMTVVFGAEGKTIGLPPDPRFEGEKGLLSAVLSPVTALGIPAVDAAVKTWEQRGKTEGIFHYRSAERAPWWAGFSVIELDKAHQVWSVVLVPEADFLGALSRLRNIVLVVIALVGALLAAVVFATSMRSIRRQMQAAMDQIERKLGQYQLKQKIGEGGNGAVYRATHALLRRPTAVKLMNPEFARSEAARSRFEHEVQIASGLSHPNTIAIYDYGQTPDGTLYYAMELLNGTTLEQLVRVSGPLPAGRVIHILEQIAGSLTEAHGKGLIHRDIKPSNAILCERGSLFDVVKVLDFGLVKQIAHTDGNLTHANVLVGTPLYMAPEIISEPGKASPQSDLYAVGAVGYFLLTGRNVFEGGSAVEICARHLNDAPVPPSQRAGLAVPKDLEDLVLACLEKDPARRPSSAEALRAALLACGEAQAWTQAQARDWWQGHSTAFSEGASSADTAPLSNTELLVDFDHRAATGISKQTRS